MKKALDTGGVTAWIQLLIFPYAALSLNSNRDDTKDVSLTAKIKRKISCFTEATALVKTSSFLETLALKEEQDNKGRNSFHIYKPRNGVSAANKDQTASSIDRLKKGVSLKLCDGDVRGAIRLLSSSNEIAHDSAEVMENLKTKHPAAPDKLDMPPSPDRDTQQWEASEGEVAAAIASFNTGSGAGLDGLRPAHLKDLIG